MTEDRQPPPPRRAIEVYQPPGVYVDSVLAIVTEGPDRALWANVDGIQYPVHVALPGRRAYVNVLEYTAANVRLARAERDASLRRAA